MGNLRFYLFLCFVLVVSSCNKDEIEIDKENYEDSDFKKKRASNSYITDVCVYPLDDDNGNGEISFIVGFKNYIQSQQVDVRYRIFNSSEDNPNWIKLYNVKSGFKISGISKKVFACRIQFSYGYEYWLSGGYTKYEFDARGIVGYFSSSSTRFSNLSITNVYVTQDDSHVLVNFDKSIEERVNLRYRKLGTSNWIEKNNVKSGDRFGKLKSAGTYELQFSYKNEHWRWGGYKTHRFQSRVSNFSITDVNLLYIINIYNPNYQYMRLDFKKSIKKNVDVRYRQLGTSNWTRVYNVDSGHMISIDLSKGYEVQFSFADEYWMWGGYKTYKLGN